MKNCGLKIKGLIRSINKNLHDSDKKYIKIKFDSHEELPLNKTVEIPIMTIVVSVVFQPQVFLDEFLYKT